MEVAKGNLEEFRCLLVDLHEILGMTATYEGTNGFEIFPTWNEVYEYFVEKQLLHTCYDAATMKEVKEKIQQIQTK